MTSPNVLLVPGAWMGAWVWDAVEERLTARGHQVRSLTLAGLESRADQTATARVRLADHVEQLVAAIDRPTVCVSHSYSGMVVGQVADRLPDLVIGSVHLGAYLPVDGRSLIDDWGHDDEARRAEAAQIHADGDLWMPPPPPMIAAVPDLGPAERQLLVDGFVPHPGRTVLDPAVMRAPLSQQTATYVTLGLGDVHPWAGAPEAVRGTGRWTARTFASDHWPMLSRPDALTDLLEEEIARWA